jgi:hypothetical protein
MCRAFDVPYLDPQIAEAAENSSLLGSLGSHTILGLVNLLVYSEHSEPINTAGTHLDRENAASSSDGLKPQSE